MESNLMESNLLWLLSLLMSFALGIIMGFVDLAMRYGNAAWRCAGFLGMLLAPFLFGASTLMSLLIIPLSIRAASAPSWWYVLSASLVTMCIAGGVAFSFKFLIPRIRASGNVAAQANEDETEEDL